MKSAHEPYDQELRERLRNYTEEPDSRLWRSIAPRIVAAETSTDPATWSTRLSVAVAGFAALVMIMMNDRFNAHNNSMVSSIRVPFTQTQPPSGQAGVAVASQPTPDVQLNSVDENEATPGFQADTERSDQKTTDAAKLFASMPRIREPDD